MKSKMTKKLVLYFLIVLGVYSIFSSILFLYFGDKNFKKSYEKHLTEKAISISESFSENENLFDVEENIPQDEQMMKRKGKDHKRMKISPDYIKWMNKVLESDVWVVDKSKNLIRFVQNGETIEFKNLNTFQQEILNNTFEGNINTTENFLKDEKGSILTASVPIKNSQGEVEGLVLLHERFSENNNFISSIGAILLLSIILSLIVVAIISVFIAKKFVEPLSKLDNMAKKLITGDYEIKSGVDQKDEIGTLANNMDKLSTRLLEAKKESEEIQKMKDDFIANISHELKTPVTVMKSSLELLKEGIIKKEEVNEYYKTLYEESSVLERLIQDLMDLTILQNANFKIKKEEVNLIDILKDSIRSQRIFALEKNIEIKINLIEEPVFFYGDYTRLRQMFITILNNAIKFSEENSKIIVNGEKSEEKIKFEITNFGKIIPKEEIDLIFNSFYRVKNTDKKVFGLGLAISKEIAKAHDITIEVKSNLEEGTKFIFKIDKNLIA